ncbi:Membrane protein YedZ [Nitrincola lacisaponensis]|uniref:Protein-methionine-sulfoxide reductase heme-binding subunit MsrQ n=1 Tax=Nitrincola lacisaponensis TaxID=267850 RepID=A0A063Y3Y7_9GAMM|nr:protein-methionine-sulfoxide reductase heme-binding subunit MsrQ [Nitrincola lacisaponensis]KDE41008.1 Membrane protein YedZ [Nitrincola lacisaponensis]
MVLTRWTAIWWLFWCAGLAPFVLLMYQVVTDQAGADPAQMLVLATGLWALRFLWLTLAVTPLRRLPRLGWLIRFRRMLGLYAFFYAVLHLLAFITFILGWRVDLVWREFTERPYIVVGLLSLLLLLPLAVTSTTYWMRRLGRNWVRLHWLIYPAAVLAMVHFIMQIRAGYAEQLLYGSLLLILLGYRAVVKLFPKKSRKTC